jgi:hypothetical protein
MEVSGQLLAPATLPTKERTPVQYPLNRRMDGPQGLSGHPEAEENLLPLPVMKPQIIQPVA